MVEEAKTQEIIGKLISVSDIRENNFGKGCNLMLRIEGLNNGVFFFGDKSHLEKINAKLNRDQLFKLSYTVEPKGLKGNVIEAITETPAEPGQKKMPAQPPKEPPVKVVYCIWSNTNEQITREQMDKYEADYGVYAFELWGKVSKLGLPPEATAVAYEKMLQPFQYYIEDDLRVKDAVKRRV